mgnify:CR=1 FL=1
MIITDIQGNKYKLIMFVVGGHFLIPYDGSKYWEHHFVPKETWVPMSDIDYNKFNLTESQYKAIVSESDKKYKEVLAKYHASF